MPTASCMMADDTLLVGGTTQEPDNDYVAYIYSFTGAILTPGWGIGYISATEVWGFKDL